MAASEAVLQQSVEELYANHHGWLRGWLHRKLGNSGDAADLAHDTFLRVLRKAVKPSEAMPAFVPETIREPRAYLTTIANGLVVSHIRRRSLEQAWLETLASLPQPQFISPEQRAVVWQTLLDVDAALATLAPRVRQAFMMAQIDGMKQRDIAVALGLSVPTIKKYMQKAWLACLYLMADD